ncbi:MAG: glycerol-3-phosphate 1-O-acyltransferase PlsY [Alphaproteobacteria bacterium]
MENDFAMFLKLFLCFVSYLLGSIPSGLLLTRFCNIDDIRQAGSGNIGATNVLRLGGKKLGFLTLFADFLKGALPVGAALFWCPEVVSLAAICAVFGHVFPVWLQFKGGKGVATSLGVLSVLSFPSTLLCCLVWLGVVRMTRYASLSSLVAFSCLPVFLLLLGETHLLLMSLILLGTAVYTHRENIHRLFLKTEFKIGEKREL